MEFHGDLVSLEHGAGLGDDAAAADVLFVDTGQVDGDPHAGLHRLHLGVVVLELSGLGLQHLGIDHQRVAGGEGSVHRGAGDHGAEALDGEDPVHGQTEGAIGGTGGRLRQQLHDLGLQLFDALAGVRGDMDDGGIFQKAALDLIADILLHGLYPLGVGQVAFGQYDDAVFHVQQGENVQMLPRLRHEALVRGDDQQHHVDAGGAHEHVVDQALMSRHVHNAGPLAVWQGQLGKADLNGERP